MHPSDLGRGLAEELAHGVNALFVMPPAPVLSSELIQPAMHVLIRRAERSAGEVAVDA